MDRPNEHNTPAASTSILTKDTHGGERKEKWNCRTMTWVLNFILNSTMPEITHATHQCTRFCEAPNARHEIAVKQIVGYLLSANNSKEYGLVMRPNKSKGLKVYIDTLLA
eukprot:2010188-Ditylum_brightwellii.AAC.1